MPENKVKFYGNSDLSSIVFFPRIKKIVDRFLEGSLTLSSIQEAIEIRNIVQYIDNETFSLDWTSEYICQVKNARLGLSQLGSQYFGKAKPEEILATMSKLNYDFLDNFFEIYAEFKYGDRISEIEFMKEFAKMNTSIRHLLKSRYFVKCYHESIKEYILTDATNIELLISNITKTSEKNLYFPENISTEEWSTLLDEYIDNPFVNLNYLRLLENQIRNLDGKKYFNVTPKQRVRIKKITQQINEIIINNNSGLVLTLAVYLQRDAYEEAVNQEKKQMPIKEAIDRSIINNIIAAKDSVIPQINCSMSALIDKTKIDNAHSFVDLLSYFCKDFNFFTENLILNLPSYPDKEMGIISQNVGFKTNNFYNCGNIFIAKNKLAIMKMQTISYVLNSWNLDVSDLICWFFTDYSSKQYGVSWLSINFPHKNESIDNRTSIFFKIEESIRKQYQIFTEENEINSDLFNETPTPQIGNLKSLFPRKYAYLADNDYAKNILFQVFNEQVKINSKGEENKECSLFEALSKYVISISDFPESQRTRIQKLIDINILEENESILRFKKQTEINLLHEIYLFGATSYIHATIEEKNNLMSLEKSGLIIFSNNFFTKKESDYMNFILNNKVFDNSLAIRNRYQHGSPNYPNPKQYVAENDISLLILMIYVIKINDEFKHQKNSIE